MNEYTNKKEVVTILERLRDCCGNGDMAFALNWAAETVKNMSAADVEEVRHGEWILTEEDVDGNGNNQYKCSLCEAGELHTPVVIVPYCWKCGAKIDKEKGR